MAKSREVSIILRARDEASKAIKNLSDGTLPSLVKSVGAAVGAFASFQFAKEQILGAVKAAAEAEKVTSRLAAALKQQGVADQSALRHLVARADALEKTTRFEAESVQNAQRLLISLADLRDEGLDRATRATLNLASALGIDLNAAALLVGKAAQGNTATLSRYGLVIGENVKEHEKFEAVLSLIEKRFGNAAQAEIKNMAGAYGELLERIDELKEAYAELAFQSTTAGGTLRTLTRIVEGMTPIVGEKGLTGLLKRFQDSGVFAFFDIAQEGFLRLASAEQEAAGKADIAGGSFERMASEGLAIVNKDLDETEKRAKAAAKAWEKLVESGFPISRGALAPDPLIRIIDEQLARNTARTGRSLGDISVSPAAGGPEQSLGLRVGLLSQGIEAAVTQAAKLRQEFDVALDPDRTQMWAEHFLDNMVAIEMQATHLVDTLTFGIGDAFARAIVYGEDFGDAMEDLGKQVLAQAISMMVQMGINSLLASAMAMKGQAAQHVTRLAELSAETYGASFASTAAIPIVGPGLAPGVAAASVAAMLAGASASAATGAATGSAIAAAGAIPFAEGGLVPGTGSRDTVPAMLTPGEFVLAKRDAERILAGQAAIVPAGGGGSTHITYNVHAVDGPSVKRLLTQHAREWEEAGIIVRSRGYRV